MGNFVNLKIKTEYSSYGVGCKIDDLIKKAKEYKMTSLCKTDWGKDGLNGDRDFYAKCKEDGINPIIGISSTLELNDEKCFITLYAQNTVGYNNLVKIFDNDNIRPSIEHILNNHDSLLCVFMQYGNHKNDTMINRLKQTFNDDLYIGLSGNGEYYSYVRELAKANKLKTVICDKVCFVNKEEFETYITNKKAYEADNGYKQAIGEKDEADLYFKSYEEILSKYPNDLDSIHRTQEIADKCNLVFETI